MNYRKRNNPAAVSLVQMDEKNKTCVQQTLYAGFALVDLEGFEPLTSRMRTERSRKVASFLPADCGVWFDENAG